MERVLRDAGGILDLLTYDMSGVLADVDGGSAPTVAVTDSAGVAMAAFTPARTASGTYQATLPANFDVLDIYDVVWTWPNGQTRRTEFELVGGFLFTLADLRASGEGELSDTTAYPASVLKQARTEAEDIFEGRTVTARAFRPKGRRYITNGSGSDTLVLPDVDVYKVVSASVDAGALTPTNIDIRARGSLVLTSGRWSWGIENVSVLYEYGMRAVPGDVRRAALSLARHILLPSPLQTGRETAVFSDIGSFRLTTAGRDGRTGYPEIDAVLAAYSAVTPLVG